VPEKRYALLTWLDPNAGQIEAFRLFGPVSSLWHKCLLEEKKSCINNKHISTHIYRPGGAIGPACVCLCVSGQLSVNEMTFDLYF